MTTIPEEKQRITLPESLMLAVRAITDDASMAPNHRFFGVLMVIWGFAWYERQAAVDPTAIALPSAQWQEICGWFTGMDDDPVARVNFGLSWMNSGPSAY